MPLATRTLLSSPELIIADVICDSGPRDPVFEERHSRQSIAFLRAGSFQYRTGKHPVTLVPGALMLGNIGASFTCSHEHCTGDRCLSFRFSAEAFEQIRREVGRDAAFADYVPPTTASLARVAPALSGDASLEETAWLLAAFSLGAHQVLKPRLITYTDRKRAVEAAADIDAGTDVTLAALAARAGLSAFHFLRTFKHALGVTPHQYLLHRRLSRAASALLESDAPVTEIAYAAGFSDLANFNRTFKKTFACAPTRYRSNFRKVILQRAR